MRKTTILALMLIAGTAAAPGRASAEQEATPLEEMAAHGSALQERHYEQATEALDRGAYERAIELFEQVIEARESRADAARYWIAYARYRSGDPAAALARLGELRAVFPTSKWLDDARILGIASPVGGVEVYAGPADALVVDEGDGSDPSYAEDVTLEVAWAERLSDCRVLPIKTT